MHHWWFEDDACGLPAQHVAQFRPIIPDEIVLYIFGHTFITKCDIDKIKHYNYIWCKSMDGSEKSGIRYDAFAEKIGIDSRDW